MVQCDVAWPDGSPVRPSPRQVLRAQLEHASALGYDAMQDPQACRIILAALLESRAVSGPTGDVTFRLSQAGDLSTDLEPKVFGGQQSNTSVIRYHFGSRDGLIRALISYRQASLGADRQEMLASMREQGKEADPRAVVWLLARPLANSIAAGEMFAPFLARVSERATSAQPSCIRTCLSPS